MLVKYLPEFVYGGIDGTITTFAVVTGSAGASLNPIIIIILGLANVFADGFSMAVSKYLSTKSAIELHQSHDPTSHPDGKIDGKFPIESGIATFFAFIIIGLIPILSFIIAFFFPQFRNSQFAYSYVLTFLTFVLIGAIRGYVVNKPIIASSLETVLIGGLAAIISFIIGYNLRFIKQ